MIIVIICYVKSDKHCDTVTGNTHFFSLFSGLVMNIMDSSSSLELQLFWLFLECYRTLDGRWMCSAGKMVRLLSAAPIYKFCQMTVEKSCSLLLWKCVLEEAGYRSIKIMKNFRSFVKSSISTWRPSWDPALSWTLCLMVLLLFPGISSSIRLDLILQLQVPIMASF